MRASLSEAWRLTGVGVVLAAAALVALGPDLTGVLTPARRAEGAHYIGLVTAAFALGLPAFSAQYVALRGFYAFEDTRTPFLLQVAIAATNVVLALAAYAVLPLAGRWSASRSPTRSPTSAGLALSTAVLRRRTGGLDGHQVVRHYVRLVAAASPRACSAGRWPGGRPVARRRLRRLAGSLAAGGLVLLGSTSASPGHCTCAELTALLARLRLGHRA